MKYIKCYNDFNEVFFVNVDNIVNITKNINLDICITVVTVNKETFYTDYESLKNPIEFEKISEIILTEII
jgi:hypothetical protein